MEDVYVKNDLGRGKLATKTENVEWFYLRKREYDYIKN